MNRRFLRPSRGLCLAVLSVAVIVAVPAGPARAVPPVTPFVAQVWLHVEGYSDEPSYGGSIHWVGSVHLTIRYYPVDPSYPYHVYSNVVGLVGVGDSGLLYRAVGYDSYASDTLSPFTQLYDIFIIQAYPIDPNLPPNPILPYSLVIQYTIVLDGGTGDVISTAAVGGLEEQ